MIDEINDLNEANELISELRNQIEELEQTIEEHEDDGDRYNEGVSDGQDKAMAMLNNKIEHAFNAGHDIIKKPMNNKLKDFLNYKMEQRL